MRLSVNLNNKAENARTNSAILKEIHRLSIPKDDMKEVFVLEMDWISKFKSNTRECDLIKVCDSGFNEYMLAVVKNEVLLIGGMQLPVSLAALDDFKVTLYFLYAFKCHRLRLIEIIEPIHHRVQNAASLNHYHFKEDTPDPNEDASGTFFTRVQKRDKQKKDKEKAPTTQGDEYISDRNNDADLVNY